MSSSEGRVGRQAPPRVSVVTPAYNGAAYVARCLESVAGQTLTEWEHVIVDDGSRDATGEIVAAAAARDPRVRLIAQENAGVAAARNRGLAACHPESEYILFLDQDDELLPGALQLLSGYLDRSPDAAMAFGAAQWVDADGRPLTMRLRRPVIFHAAVGPRGRLYVRRTRRRTLGLGDLVVVNPIPTPGMCLIRRSALRQTGDFDPALAPCDDWDLWLRLAALAGSADGAPIHRLPDPVLRWRRHDACQSTRFAFMRHQRRMVYEKHLSHPETAAIVRAVLPMGRYGVDAILCRHFARRAFAERSAMSGLRFLVRSARWDAARLLLQARLSTGAWYARKVM